MTERVRWEELPAELRDTIQAHTGPVIASKSVASGFNCTVALEMHTRGSGRLFLKGVRTSDKRGMDGLLREERINNIVRGIGPAIRHRFDATGWCAVAFTHIDGRHVDYGPGTKDLKAVADTLNRMYDLRAPAFPVPQLSDRFDVPLKPGEAEALHGTHLLHTDTNPHNVLIDRDSGTAYLVDWAMPALGPPWVDAAYTATWLMCFEQAPEDALAWLSGIPSWQQADPQAVEAFVDVTCREFTAGVGARDAAASNARFRHLLTGLRTQPGPHS
ncbi:phosphotransferase [Streptomyces tsukubensis]|uniref:phosphotransferase n=1 Tax=Streptomyces tsukubensis TaxID=83656 RepID=UPI00344BD630